VVAGRRLMQAASDTSLACSAFPCSTAAP
jgi:hypothetical protein